MLSPLFGRYASVAAYFGDLGVNDPNLFSVSYPPSSSGRPKIQQFWLYIGHFNVIESDNCFAFKKRGYFGLSSYYNGVTLQGLS